MDILSSIIMGIIEGLTEFLPVSSTGHMILTAHLLGLSTDEESVKTFEVVVQLGAVLAVVVLYWHTFIDLFKIKPLDRTVPRLNLLHIFLAMVPAGVAAVLLRDVIKAYLFGPETVVYSLVAGGLLMIAAEKWHKSPLRLRSTILPTSRHLRSDYSRFSHYGLVSQDLVQRYPAGC